ncbi:hypothetical protein [Spiroplasma tabanidicola]|uniref:Lipoprotein-associated type-17 domain-containing protein n=1 Tax=Spiroplasma tabanidicola TaxID=324079 RepID=A0A6I6CBP5_9MOLU|nr:hypothetical protein [Spiroplasma tabanidicola]QGS51394.1 hypothetical protein STABA_v1c00270 [Spiroplasma tabanidicola]
MKKLLSLVSAFSLGAISSVSATSAGCQIPTKAIKITVDGKEKSEDNEDVLEVKNYDNSVGQNKVVGVTNLLLEAITFTDEKYQDSKTLKKQKDFLGDQGQSLSLMNYIKKNSDSTDSVFKDFKNSYEASRNTNFIAVNFERSDAAKKGQNSLFSLKDDARVFVVKKTKENKEVTKSEIVDSFDLADGLDGHTSFKSDAEHIIKTGASLNETFAALAQGSDAQNRIFENYDSANTYDQEIVTRARKLDSTLEDEKTNKPLKLLGEFEVPKQVDNKVVEPIDGNAPKAGKTDDKFRLYNSDDGKIIQASSTLIHTESKSFAKISLDFDDPGNNSIEERKFRIDYNNLDKVILQWSLKTVDITAVTSTNNPDGIEHSIYWYEPYQYIFKNTTENEKQDMFNIYDKNFTPNITIFRK